jgi:hypothetical protein
MVFWWLWYLFFRLFCFLRDRCFPVVLAAHPSLCELILSAIKNPSSAISQLELYVMAPLCFIQFHSRALPFAHQTIITLCTSPSSDERVACVSFDSANNCSKQHFVCVMGFFRDIRFAFELLLHC